MDCELHYKIFLERSIADYFNYLETDKYFLNRTPKITTHGKKNYNWTTLKNLLIKGRY